METSDNVSLCVLCCYSVPFNSITEQNNRQCINKFIQQTEIKTISSSNDLLEDGQLSICENCLFTINLAVDKRQQVEEVEVHVRNVQEEILRLLRELKELIDGYLEDMTRLERTIRNSDESCLRSKLGWNRNRVQKGVKTAENVFHFRHGIINVVDELGRFQDGLNSKIVHNPSTDSTTSLKTEQVKCLELYEDPGSNGEDDHDLDDDGKDPLGDLEFPSQSSEQNVGTGGDNDNSRPKRTSSRRTKEKMKLYLERSDEDDSTNDQDDNFKPGDIPTESQEESEDDNGDDDPLTLSDSNEQKQRSPKISKPKIGYFKKRYNCPDCERVFGTGPLLIAHAASQHNNLRPFKCPQCSKTFNTLSNLWTHKETHQNSKDNPQYKCGLCPKAFTSKSSMKKHIKAHQDGGYPCTECGTLLWSKVSLRKHLASHEKKKQIEWLKCDKCESQYETKEKLEKHKKLHERKMEHRCEHCNRTFHSPGYLQQHINAVHLKLKNRMCTICGKSFSKNYGLKEHMLRKHYPEKWAVIEKNRQKKKEGGEAKKEQEPETVHYQDDFLMVYS